MSDHPYDEYVKQALSEYLFSAPAIKDEQGNVRIGETYRTTISRGDLEALLADAWLSGLAYSLNLIEGEKERRNVHKS